MELKKPILLPNEEEIISGEYGKDFRFFPIDKTSNKQ